MTQRKRRTAPGLVQIVHASAGHTTQKLCYMSDPEERSDRLDLGVGLAWGQLNKGPMHLRYS